MKRVVIVHCWSGYPDYCWYPQTKRELTAAGFEVAVPQMPQTDMPNLSLWLPELRKVAGQPSEDLFLVGHSAGAITIMRYLEALPENQRVGGIVLVAPFINDLGHPELKNFFLNPLDFGHIRSHTDNIVLIESDDDPLIPLLHGVILKEKLGSELIIKHKMQHFSGPIDDENSCTLLPDVGKWVMKMAQS